MSIMFIVALVSGVMFVLTGGLKLSEDGTLGGVILAGGFFMLMLTVPVTLHDQHKRANGAYEAAAKQDITIVTNFWRQTPVATQPCRVTLKLDGKGKHAKLILPNSGKKVTPEMLDVICGTT